MSRQIYENSSTLAEERRIAALLSVKWNCNVIKLPRAYALDYAGIRDGLLRSWIEIKRRNIGLHQFDEGVMLSLHKVQAAEALESISDTPSFFVVQFNDCLAWAPICRGLKPIAFAGRTDRGDWQDMEPCVMFAPKYFRVIA